VWSEMLLKNLEICFIHMQIEMHISYINNVSKCQTKFPFFDSRSLTYLAKQSSPYFNCFLPAVLTTTNFFDRKNFLNGWMVLWSLFGRCLFKRASTVLNNRFSCWKLHHTKFRQKQKKVFQIFGRILWSKLTRVKYW
jgi:hypothetical protein